MPDARLYQIIPVDSGKLLLAFTAIREFGIFNPSNFTYKKIPLKTLTDIPARAEFYAWRDSEGQVCLNILHYGILQFDKKEHSFIDNNPFPLPKGWHNTLYGIHDDPIKKQLWICADSGLCIYDRPSKKMWTRNYNPQDLPVLKNETVQNRPSQVFIDRQWRIWLFGWPDEGSNQVKYCLDSTRNKYLQKDTIGLDTGPVGYTEFSHFYETDNSNLWIYGMSVLSNYNKSLRRFQFHKSGSGNDNININYEDVYQVMEDKMVAFGSLPTRACILPPWVITLMLLLIWCLTIKRVQPI